MRAVAFGLPIIQAPEASHRDLLTFGLVLPPHSCSTSPSPGLPALPLTPGSSLIPREGLPDSAVILTHSNLRSRPLLEAMGLPGLLRRLWEGKTPSPGPVPVADKAADPTVVGDISVVCNV